jgi:hypothetical protein
MIEFVREEKGNTWAGWNIFPRLVESLTDEIPFLYP